jgi:hypothetical protein
MVNPGGGIPQPALIAGQYGHSLATTTMVLAAKRGAKVIRVDSIVATNPPIGSGAIVGIFSAVNNVTDQLYTVKSVAPVGADFDVTLEDSLVDDYTDTVNIRVQTVTVHPVGKVLDLQNGKLTGACARLWSFPYAWDCVLKNGTLDDSGGAPGQAASWDLAGKNNRFENLVLSFASVTSLITECNFSSTIAKCDLQGVMVVDDSGVKNSYIDLDFSCRTGDIAIELNDDQGRACQGPVVSNCSFGGGAACIISQGAGPVYGLRVDRGCRVEGMQFLAGTFQDFVLENSSGTPFSGVGQPWISLAASKGVVSACELLPHAPAAVNQFDERYLVADAGSVVEVNNLRGVDCPTWIYAAGAGARVNCRGGDTDSSSVTTLGTTHANFYALNGAEVTLSQCKHQSANNAFCGVLQHGTGGAFHLEDYQSLPSVAGFDIMGDATGGVWIGQNCRFGVLAGFSANARPSRGTTKLVNGVVVIPFPLALAQTFPKLSFLNALGTWGVQYYVQPMAGVGASVTSLTAAGVLAALDQSQLQFEF